MNDDDRYDQATEDYWHWYYKDLDSSLDEQRLASHHERLRLLSTGNLGRASEGKVSSSGRAFRRLDDVEAAYQRLVATINRSERLSEGIRRMWLEQIDEIDLQSVPAEEELQAFRQRVLKFARDLPYLESYTATTLYRSELESIAWAIDTLARACYWRSHLDENHSNL